MVTTLRLTFDDGPDPVWTPRLLDALGPARRARDVLPADRAARPRAPDARRPGCRDEGHASGCTRRARAPLRARPRVAAPRHRPRAGRARLARRRARAVAHAVGRRGAVDRDGRAPSAACELVRLGRRHPRLARRRAPRRCSPRSSRTAPAGAVVLAHDGIGPGRAPRPTARETVALVDAARRRRCPREPRCAPRPHRRATAARPAPLEPRRIAAGAAGARAPRRPGLPRGRDRRARGRRARWPGTPAPGRRARPRREELELVRRVARADGSVGPDRRRPPQRRRAARRAGARGPPRRASWPPSRGASCAPACGAATRCPGEGPPAAVVSHRARRACCAASRPSARAPAACTARSCSPRAPERRAAADGLDRPDRRRARRGRRHVVSRARAARLGLAPRRLPRRAGARALRRPGRDRRAAVVRPRRAAHRRELGRAWPTAPSRARWRARRRARHAGALEELAAGRIVTARAHDRPVDGRRGPRRWTRPGTICPPSPLARARRDRRRLPRPARRGGARLRLAALRARPRRSTARGATSSCSCSSTGSTRCRARRRRGAGGARDERHGRPGRLRGPLPRRTRTRGATRRSAYEQAKYAATLDACGPGPFGRALELGASIGVFTALLAPRCRPLVTVDLAPTAVAAARERLRRRAAGRRSSQGADPRRRCPRGPFDLVVASEILYYLEPRRARRARSRACASRWRRRAGSSPSTGARPGPSGRSSAADVHAALRDAALAAPRRRPPTPTTTSSTCSSADERARSRSSSSAAARPALSAAARLPRGGRRAARSRSSPTRTACPTSRPPLTKELLRGEMRGGGAAARGASGWLAEHDVRPRRRPRGRARPGGARRVTLSGGRELRLRDAACWPPAPSPSACRSPAPTTRACACCARSTTCASCWPGCADGAHVVVIGSGFIGCEIAASLRMRGHAVTLVSDEAAPNVGAARRATPARAWPRLAARTRRRRCGSARAVERIDRDGDGSRSSPADDVARAAARRDGHRRRAARRARRRGRRSSCDDGAVPVDAAMRTRAARRARRRRRRRARQRRRRARRCASSTGATRSARARSPGAPRPAPRREWDDVPGLLVDDRRPHAQVRGLGRRLGRGAARGRTATAPSPPGTGATAASSACSRTTPTRTTSAARELIAEGAPWR